MRALVRGCEIIKWSQWWLELMLFLPYGHIKRSEKLDSKGFQHMKLQMSLYIDTVGYVAMP